MEVMMGGSEIQLHHPEEPTTGPVLQAKIKEEPLKNQDEDSREGGDTEDRVVYTGNSSTVVKRHQTPDEKLGQFLKDAISGSIVLKDLKEAGKHQLARLKYRELLYMREKFEKERAEDEVAKKAESSVTEPGSPGKAEAYVTEKTGRPLESEANKAACLRLFDNAFGAKLEGFWNRLFEFMLHAEEEDQTEGVDTEDHNIFLQRPIKNLKQDDWVSVCIEEEKMEDFMRVMRPVLNLVRTLTLAGEREEAELKYNDLLDSLEKFAKKKAEDIVAGKHEEAELKYNDLLDSLEKSAKKKGNMKKSAKKKGNMKKSAKKKAEDIVAGKAESSVTEPGTPQESVTEAGKAQAYVTETDRPLESVTEVGKSVTEAGKAQAYVTETDRPLESVTEVGKSVTEAGKAEAYVTETDRPLESVTEVGKSVTEATKAAAKTSDASTALHAVRVFEDAENFGAKFESFWNRLFSCYSAYDENTTIPAMCYTHGSDCDVMAMDTLQVISIKVASIEEDLRWPLQVFGMVSARDVLDRKRNIIFHRERNNCQTITEQNPYLMLTGPSRGVVVSTDPSYIEVVLKVKGSTVSEDKELSRLAVRYRIASYVSGLYPCKLSTLELRFCLVADSVEATVHVKVTRGSWPAGFKGEISAADARYEGLKVKLLDISDDGLPVDAADGMIKLSRRVVSVQEHSMLKVFVSACSAAGDEERCEASFVPADAGVSSGIEIKIGSCCMEATVAWSLFHYEY